MKGNKLNFVKKNNKYYLLYLCFIYLKKKYILYLKKEYLKIYNICEIVIYKCIITKGRKCVNSTK